MNHTFVVAAYGESPYLKDAIESVLNQTLQTNVLVTTSTPNDNIRNTCEKYGVELRVNPKKEGIAADWNFAINEAKTQYVTIAHQDDLYEQDYTSVMLRYINKSREPILAFCEYYEERNGERIENNKLLRIKRLMNTPLLFEPFWYSRIIRHLILSFGCPFWHPICYLQQEEA